MKSFIFNLKIFGLGFAVCMMWGVVLTKNVNNGIWWTWVSYCLLILASEAALKLRGKL